MQLQVQNRNVEVDSSLREYLAEKVEKLERYLPQISEVRAELQRHDTRVSSDRFTVQITAWANGKQLRAEESTGSVRASIDQAVNKLCRQVRRVKRQRLHRQRVRDGVAVNSSRAVEISEQVEMIENEPTREIVRRKRFHVEPMSEEEALEQMELLGHDFFVFFDPADPQVRILYRRRDQNFGLLEPMIV